ncbi:hypothetical protein NQZ68_032107 [Dissostichus eleginoides]|nr:hypothetical protein NQZ68_032107 [Dissostichus eleginoides]
MGASAHVTRSCGRLCAVQSLDGQGAKMTVVSDPAEALALAKELSVLLAKDAIEPVDPLLSPGGSTRRTFS